MKYKVAKSKIPNAGKGLFAKEPIKKGENIGIAHRVKKINKEQYKTIPTSIIGKYHNHNEKNPTAINILQGDKRYLVAQRDIQPGEEITTNYRLQPDLEQPEDFQKGGMTPQKDGYRTYSPFKNLPYIDVETDTIDTNNIVHDLQLVSDNGVTKNVKKNTGLHKIAGANIIREIPIAKKGGRTKGLVSMPKPSKKGLASKKYSRSLDATNFLFTRNPLFKKPKSRKNKVYHPYAKYYQDGGDTLPDDYSEFEKFSETLPSNLQDPDFEYGNPDQYNLYGMWETVGKPKSFQDVQDSDYFPLQDDGTYHGFTVGSDGEFLKPMSHGTTWKEVMNAHLNTDPYFQQNRIIKNEQDRLQYIPKEKDGGYIDLELDDAEIAQYVNGGYIVEALD